MDECVPTSVKNSRLPLTPTRRGVSRPGSESFRLKKLVATSVCQNSVVNAKVIRREKWESRLNDHK
jgi:hypothetical protein